MGTLRRSVQMSAAPRRIHLAQPSSLFSCTWVPSLGMKDCSANGLGLPLVLFLGDTGDCPSYILVGIVSPMSESSKAATS